MDRYRVIEKFAKEKNWTQGLELGVWVGVTTFWLMKNTTVNMVCVDAWAQAVVARAPRARRAALVLGLGIGLIITGLGLDTTNGRLLQPARRLHLAAVP